MTELLSATFPRTLDTLVAECATPQYDGASIDIWTFDSTAARAAAARTLSSHGVSATVRSAYKPLVFAFLEELPLDGYDAIAIHYPTVPDVPEGRFRLECYPVTELVGARSVTFAPLPQRRPGGLLSYTVILTGPDGRADTVEIAAPNAFYDDHTGTGVLASTGWIRVHAPSAPELYRDGALRTDQELAFRHAMSALADHGWQGEGPYFDRLTVRIAAPFYEHPLAVGTECISTAEAMHEEVYFSALEVFRHIRGLDPDDRTLQPGQIIPELVVREGPVELSITLDPPGTAGGPPPEPAGPTQDVETTPTWLTPTTVKAELDALGGAPYQVSSRQGRPVWGVHVPGPAPTVVISASQHANEATGPVGALRAAKRLRRAGDMGFAVSPLENPDGYALYRHFCAQYSHHLHHAARYTACGNDLEYCKRGYEKEIRYLGRDKTGAEFHINMHGYPAHEWTRPFTGYLPRGFELWSIPKGFFLILRYQPGWQARAENILHAVIAALAAYAPLVAVNRRQLARYRQYVPDAAFDVHDHIPVFAGEDTQDALFPMTLITESPDQGISGDQFVVQHTAQLKAVLAAAAAHHAAKP